jgi:two-component system response regulator QseB
MNKANLAKWLGPIRDRAREQRKGETARSSGTPVEGDRSMRVLVVEDDPEIHAALAADLRRQYLAVDVAQDGETALDYARTGVYDVILLDVMLPGIDGLSVCRILRAERSQSFILMLTARDSVDDKVAALDTGADDYIVKPFDLAEVSARIRAVSRRNDDVRAPLIVRGSLVLDSSRQAIAYAGNDMPLTRTEYAIVEALMRSPRQIFSRDLLLDKITDFERNAGYGSIKTHITNIRRKIRAAGGRRDCIESVYGAGYRLANFE